MRHYSVDISVNLRSKDDMKHIDLTAFQEHVRNFTALQVHAFGAGKLSTADS